MVASHRMAVYGGTFDPVHNGHVEVARRILKLFELDEVVFMPAYVAPHKMKASVSPAFHRYAMLALATQDDEWLKISTAELEAPELPYTVETIARLKAESGEATRLFFIMGADSWSEITTWRDWQRLLGLCDYIIITRPGYDLKPESVPVAAENIVDTRGLDHERMAVHLSEDKKLRVFVTDAVMLDISATEVRAVARAGDRERLRKLVPPRVAEYIEKYRLYGN